MLIPEFLALSAYLYGNTAVLFFIIQTIRSFNLKRVSIRACKTFTLPKKKRRENHPLLIQIH